MKGKVKRIAALFLMLVFVMSSVLVGNADSSKTIPRTNSVTGNSALNHKEVSVKDNTTDRGTFQMYVKRFDDIFDMYRIVDITAVTSKKNTSETTAESTAESTAETASASEGITELKFSWVTPIKSFIAAHDEFKNDTDYADPAALGAYQKGEAGTGNKQDKIIKLMDAVRNDTTAWTAMASYKVASVTSSKVNDLKTNGYTPDTNINGVTGTGNIFVKPNGEGSAGSYKVTSYELSNVLFGIYYMDASNTARTNGGGYQPVVVEMVPEQTGPSGHWYMDNTRTYQLKNEEIKVTKTINGSSEDIVRVGEVVHFSIDFEVPLYPKAFGSNNQVTSTTDFAYTWFGAFDESTEGFTLIPTSAKLTYFDAQGNEYHPHAVLNVDRFGNMSAADGGGDVVDEKNTVETSDDVTNTLQAENTYIASLVANAIPYYSTADATQKTLFWLVPEGDSSYTICTLNNGILENVTNGFNGTFTSQIISAINGKRGTDEKITYDYSTMTAKNSGHPQSILGISFDYNKLMAPGTYTANKDKEAAYAKQNADSTVSRVVTEKRESAFTYPSKVVITYDAIVNDNFSIGTDDNNNTVWINYISDTDGTKSQVSSTVNAWSYGADIIKVDGEKYADYEKKTTSEEKAAVIANADTNPFLSEAYFDIYRYDTTYCGGATATAAPTSASARSGYKFYSDYANTFTSSQTTEARHAAAKLGFVTEKELKDAIKHELVIKGGIRAEKQIVAAISQTYVKLGDWKTADTFTNKYNYAGLYNSSTGVTALATVAASSSINLLTDYIFPKAADTANNTYWNEATDFTGSGKKSFVQYVPVQVDSCDFCQTQHYHMEAYALYYTGIQSDKTKGETGVYVNGLDENKYLLIETKAPSGYNALESAIYFEVNKYSNAEYEADGNSYKNFKTDEYKHDDGTVASDDSKDGKPGYYPFTIKNFSGLTLPSTGGMGTLLFTLLGIIIMISTIIFFVIKNRKFARNSTAFMLAVLLASSTLLGALGTDFQAEAATLVGTQSSSTDGSGTVATKAVQNGTVEFTLWCDNKDDLIKLYPIGYSNYDATTQGWGEAKWDGKIVAKYTDSSYGFEKEYPNYTLPTDPQVYSDASTETQAAFLEWINKHLNDMAISSMYDENVTINTTKSSNGKYAAKISGVGYGLYMAVVKSQEGKTFAPLLLTAIPQEQAPTGGWYVSGIREAYVKYADVQVLKKINKKDSDAVRNGEEVEFEVLCEVPEYKAIDYTVDEKTGNYVADVIPAGDAYNAYDWNKYYEYAFTDIMSGAFQYVPDSLQVKYTTSVGSLSKIEDVYAASSAAVTWSDLSTEAYKSLFTEQFSNNKGLLVFRDSTDTAGYYMFCNVTGSSSPYSCTWYIYNSKKGTFKQYTTSTSTNPGSITGPDSANITAYKTATGVTSVGTFTKIADYGGFNGITFDYQKLQSNLGTKADGSERIKYVKISYKAKVTDKCLPGSEENINTGYVWYRNSIAGDYGNKEDTVNAYTYGFSLAKVDGTVSSKYLEGAKFEVYKDAYLFVPNQETAAAPESSTYEKWTFAKGADNDEFREVAITAVPGAGAVSDENPQGVKPTLEELNEAAADEGIDHYYRYVSASGNCGVDGCHYKETDGNHVHVRVYKRMTLQDQTSTNADSTIHNDVKDDVITSVAKASGVTIKGIENASYALIETNPPTGYNPLTEAMIFDINLLSEDMHKLSANSNYTSDAMFYSSIAMTQSQTDGKVDIVRDGTPAVKGADGTVTTPESLTDYYQGYSNGIYGITVKNYKGLTLPSTGGMGTILFTILGILIMAIVIILLITKNRKNMRSY